MPVRPAKEADINPLLQITDLCREHMEKQGIFQWTKEYPNRGAFENDVKRKELFVLEELQILGCIVISTFKDDVYIPVKWRSDNENCLYIHRLAVHPEHQGRGHAQELMDFAESFGRKNGFHSIRLDTFSQNKRNQHFYEKRGYERLESIFFPLQSSDPFYCYEKLL